MIREGTLSDISDGKRYSSNDMVKLDTCNCEGCHKCCTNVGNTIVLDPYDIVELKYGLKLGLQELLSSGYIELNLVDGLILPNIRMNEKNQCSFLNSEGRCTVHNFRPGICRLFPLGRIYNSDDSFDYFLQQGECAKELKVKLKIKKWLGVSKLDKYEKYISTWHMMIKNAGQVNIKLRDSGKGEKVNDVAMFVLNSFYVNDFEQTEDLLDILMSKIEEANKAIINI